MPINNDAPSCLDSELWFVSLTCRGSQFYDRLALLTARLKPHSGRQKMHDNNSENNGFHNQIQKLVDEALNQRKIWQQRLVEAEQ
jgi:hypothetical protein